MSRKPRFLNERLVLTADNKKIDAKGNPEESLKSHLKPRMTPAIIFTSVLLMLGVLAIGLFIAGRLIEENDRSDLDSSLAPYAAVFSNELTRRLGRISGMAAHISSHEDIIEPGGFQQTAEHLIYPDIGVRNFQLLRGTVTEQVYPLEGNSQMIGVDWSKTEENRKHLEEAINARTQRLIGPFEAHPATWVIAVVEPVYGKRGSLLATVAAVYDWSYVVKNSHFDGASMNMKLAVRSEDDKLMYGRAEVFKQNPVIRQVTVGGQTWTLAAVPKGGWTLTRNNQLIPYLISGLFVILLMTLLLVLLVDRQRRLEIAVNQRTLALKTANKELETAMKNMVSAQHERDRVAVKYSTLSEINECILKAKTVDELIEKTCEILVKEIGYEITWIGFKANARIEKTTGAIAGVKKDLINEMIADAKDKETLISQVIKASKRSEDSKCQLVAESGILGVWTDKVLKEGLLRLCTIPIEIGGKVEGAMAVFPKGPDILSKNETRLLYGVAANVSYGLERLGKDAEIEHLASFPRFNPNPVIEFESNGALKYANDAARNMLKVAGADDDIDQFKPADFKEIAQMMDKDDSSMNIKRDVAIKDRIFSETVHLAGRFGSIRIYAIDITGKEKNEAIMIQQKEELERSYGVIKRSLEGTVKAIAAVAEHKDPYTSGHEQRVVGMASAIAKELGESETFLEGLKIAAAVHDIGKIYIPAEILSKPGKLNELEFKMIKEHPRYSYEILKTIDFPWPVAEMALQHHEKIDGSGYPRGLKGREIMPEAKILAVADIVEAMGSHRPYRPALPLETALEEVKKGRGKIFDPKVVDAAVKIFKDGYKI